MFCFVYFNESFRDLTLSSARIFNKSTVNSHTFLTVLVYHVYDCSDRFSPYFFLFVKNHNCSFLIYLAIKLNVSIFYKKYSIFLRSCTKRLFLYILPII